MVVVERSDRVGGRVATDRRDGFLLDRGFQVLLTSYPEVQDRLDLDALELRAFRSGSAVRLPDRTCLIADPYREPWTAVRALFTPLLSLPDALRAHGLRRRLLGSGPFEGRASDLLADSGISEGLLASFFRPFFQGVTLDAELGVPADYFAFLFRMFAHGEATLPRDGMAAVPQQLARRLPEGSVRLQTGARAVGRDHVVLDDGTRLDASGVVVATEGPAAARLTEAPAPSGHRSTTCVYFAVRGAPPFAPKVLLLNGTGAGRTLHMSVPSVVQPSYAPDGHHLVSVTTLGDADEHVVEAVRADLRAWFGNAADDWTHLHTSAVPYALPELDPDEAVMERQGAVSLASGVVVCGAHLATPSIQGAMSAGRSAAELVLTRP